MLCAYQVGPNSTTTTTTATTCHFLTIPKNIRSETAPLKLKPQYFFLFLVQWIEVSFKTQFYLCTQKITVIILYLHFNLQPTHIRFTQTQYIYTILYEFHDLFHNEFNQFMNFSMLFESKKCIFKYFYK